MYHDRQDLDALIGSRICHDLISPLGAVSNGLELLALNGTEASPELDLVSDSIKSANAKIRFFRIAFGYAANGTSISQPEIASVLKDYFSASRLGATWHPLREVQRREAKLLFLAILCLESALPFGGTLDIHHDGQNWVLSGVSEKLRINPDHWQVINGENAPENMGAAEVQFILLAHLTRWRKPALRIDIDQNDILICL